MDQEKHNPSEEPRSSLADVGAEDLTADWKPRAQAQKRPQAPADEPVKREEQPAQPLYRDTPSYREAPAYDDDRTEEPPRREQPAARRPAASSAGRNTQKGNTVRQRNASTADRGDNRDNRGHASTATHGAKPFGKSGKREAVDLDSRPRSAKPAHQVLPYVFAFLTVILFVCLLVNVFCNWNNKCADDPSAHWFGTFGYYVCYGLFGMFGAGTFVLPFLFLLLAVFWKKYVDHRVATAKILVSAVFTVLFGAVVHIIDIAHYDPEKWKLPASELIRHGACMTGGGLIGGGTGYFLASFMNILGSLIVVFFLLAVSFFFLLGMTPAHLWNHLKNRRDLRREGRGTVSEKEARRAEMEARMKEKADRRRGDRQNEPEAAAKKSNAVVRSESGEPADGKQPDDGLAPMPIPVIDPHEGELFIPADVTRKMGAEAQTAQPAQPMTQPVTQPAAQTAQPTPTAKAEPTAAAPQPAKTSAAEHAGNRDAAVDPIFPKSNHAQRHVPRAERNFDLRNVFIEIDDPEKNVPKKHAPVPPEVPLPGTAAKPRPVQPAQPAQPAHTQPAHAQPAQKPVSPAARPTAPTGTASGARPDIPLPRTPAHAGTVQKPTVRVGDASKNPKQDFGMTDEEFERIEQSQGNSPLSPKPKTAPKGALPGVKPNPAGEKPAVKKPEPAPVAPKPPKPVKPKAYIFPPISYLHPGEPPTEANVAEIQAKIAALQETFQNFNVGVSHIEYITGPTVTLFEVTPAPGVSVKRITALEYDISAALQTTSIRLYAPIPGKSAVGIEVPNRVRTTVYLRDLLESKEFTQASSKTISALGEDATGAPLFFDISKMPHLLVAGTTGSGKSVCINCILMSLLYHAKPEDVRLIMIDPKKVEFSVYRHIPHLLVPILNNPIDATAALQAAVEEMERRYGLMEEVGVRDIKGYNAATKDDPERPTLPMIVIIIDELADLMMSASKQVEQSICRIAQKARACGMYLIIGTQRPSVDVVTGLIKGNVPSRIAFTVASQIDSKTILNYAGAEKLTGKGDMLFAPVGALKNTRVQGPFVSDEEVEKVCEFTRAQNGTAEYDTRFTEKIKELSTQAVSQEKSELGDGGDGDHGDDAKYVDAVKIALEDKKVSTSLLQRKLGVGYSRAAKLIDRMQAEGIVSAPDGSKPRTLLITQEDFLNMFPPEEQ